MKKKLLFLISLALFFLLPGKLNNTLAQTERNPLLEFCTGTWCQWCPCGDVTIEDLLAAHPNLIPLAYHGPAGSDPYATFPGNEIIGLMGFTGYPTATVDRSSALGDYNTWTSKVNTRINVPATVSIDLQKSFNETTGQLDATVDVTPLQDLTGQYNYNIVLTEDSLIYNQVNNGACVGGGTNWVHDWVVRSMINGAAGENLNTGSTWSNGDMISKTVSYTISSSYNFDKCNLIVFVYKQNSPLYLAEVQQAEKWTLISPNYVASASSNSPDVIASNSTPATFNVVVKNKGLLADTYDLGVDLSGPSGWVGQFTTTHGTFNFGETDSVQVDPGDSTMITITVDPSGINGAGRSMFHFVSRYDPGNQGTTMLRNVTSTGVYGLVVDATNNKYASYVDSSLQDVFSESYGIISRTALQQPGVDLSHFYLMTWSQGTAFPAFKPEEVNALQSYLDNGGNLFINGQDIGSDIFEPTGNSQFAKDFYHNYLHAAYVANASNFYLMNGVPGDIIGDGLQFVPGFIYDKSLEKISRYDEYADSIFTYSTGPNVSGIRADNGTSRIVYLGFGIEQIDDRALRDTILSRSINWLTENVVVNTDNRKSVSYDFNLKQNYPNPFNPTTMINYSISTSAFTTLKVYDVLGNEVATLVNGENSAGNHNVEFNASKLSSGIYFYKLQSGSFVQTKKMMLLK
jgi:Outer membrane protein Omp28/Secretion system C-terminal sorting domain